MSNQAGLAKARGRSRLLAMQAIYQWQMTGADVDSIKSQFLEENNSDNMDVEYFVNLLTGVIANTDDIDSHIEPNIDRTVSSVDPVERAILRIGCYELLKCLDVPYRVILNEAINLAKKFCAEQSHTFVNAVLDKTARSLRSSEMSAT